MSELTREGNPVLSHDALIRQHIKGNSESLCAKCKHVMDACADINRKATLVRGFHEIYWCEGFEIAPDNHTGTTMALTNDSFVFKPEIRTNKFWR